MCEPPAFRLRDTSEDDLDFAWLLYRDLMKPLTSELLDWNEQNQTRTVQEALRADGTSIIVISESPVGWLQVHDTDEAIYLAQLYIRPEDQNQGIGTAIVRQLCDRARQQDKALKLDVMINNRAVALYERLGFRHIGRSKYKIEMQWSDKS